MDSLDPDKLTRLGHKLGLGMLNLSRNRDSPPQDRVKLHPVTAAAVRELAIDQCELDGFLTQRESQDVRTQLYEPAFYLRRGMHDVLGPGGIYLLKPADWDWFLL